MSIVPTEKTLKGLQEKGFGNGDEKTPFLLISFLNPQKRGLEKFLFKRRVGKV